MLLSAFVRHESKTR